MYYYSSENSTSLQPLPVQANILNYSVLNNFQARFPIRRFAIKYVVSGTEEYTINGHRYAVSAGSYLLANRFAQGQVYVESKKPVRGICIDLAPDLISEAVASVLRPDTCIADKDLDKFFNSADFLENLYQGSSTLVGADLRFLEKELSVQPELLRNIPDDVYFTVAEHVVADHIPIFKQLQQVPAIKHNTKKELYKRLQSARTFMQAAYASSPTIQVIARHCNLSEFHFFRLFKQVYGITPHQYITELKLQRSAELLKQPGISIAETAALSGFPDVYAFSKVFKKRYGRSPGAWRLQ